MHMNELKEQAMDHGDDYIDLALSRLGNAPVHPGLAASDAAVLARLSMQREAPASLKFGPLAAVVAAIVGLASSGISSQQAEASPGFSLFGPAPPLAPSTLLAGNG
jgi:hypothetical protein